MYWVALKHIIVQLEELEKGGETELWAKLQKLQFPLIQTPDLLGMQEENTQTPHGNKSDSEAEVVTVTFCTAKTEI